MAPEITVRVWNRRRDRSAIERWPAAQLPASWRQVLGEAGRRERWAVDQAGELVGSITLREFRGDSATIGIYLRPDKYGQGIGTAALLEFVPLSPVHFLLANVAIDNHRAVNCYRKVGFTRIWDMPGYILMAKYVHAPNRATINRALIGDTN